MVLRWLGCRSTIGALAFGVGALAATSNAAAGGFAIREQSTSSQGTSFAGSAAGYDLSSMFWNPAAVGVKGSGLNTESHYSVIVPRADITVERFNNIPVAGTPLAAFAESGDIGAPAVVGASYASYQISEKVFVGLGINSPFGLATEPDHNNYLGAELGRSTKLLTVNANPVVGYRIAPGITIAAGVQAQYADGELKFATGAPFGPSSGFEGSDWAFGGTAGILVEPVRGTSIGLGYRSQLSHTLEGDFYTNASALTGGRALASRAEADINLPDIVTFSLRQMVSSRMRVMGTVEWSNWSRFEDLSVVSKDAAVTIFGPVGRGATVATIDAGWEDGWFFSGGAEYDATSRLTVRAGVAYEISPVRKSNQRILGIPDSDRVWLSLGASAKLTDATTIDLAFTHIVLEDSEFDRTSFAGRNISGDVEASTDIFSVSMKTKW